MEDYKELRIEADTFDKLRSDADIVLQRALGTMKEKESMDGKVTITIDIKLVPEFIRTMIRLFREKPERF